MKVIWFTSQDVADCDRCDDLIGVGDRCAWIPGTDELVCLGCGGAAGQHTAGRAA